MEDIIETIGNIYDTVGFNHLLAALDTLLIRRWAACQREPLTSEAGGGLAREIAQLKKARLPLTDAERAEIRERGLLWTPRS